MKPQQKATAAEFLPSRRTLASLRAAALSCKGWARIVLLGGEKLERVMANLYLD